jgi:hypothetical protein
MAGNIMLTGYKINSGPVVCQICNNVVGSISTRFRTARSAAVVIATPVSRTTSHRCRVAVIRIVARCSCHFPTFEPHRNKCQVAA